MKISGCSARLDLNPIERITLAHNLGKNGNGQKFFTHEVRRMSDPYVPFDTGALKNTAVEYPKKIVYVQVYSRRQWYEHRGNGMRGPKWCLRMWQSHKGEIIRSVANYCGGKAK